MHAPADRLEALLGADAVRVTGEPTLVESHSNDTWLATTPDGLEVVVRVCWIGDRERILREAAVGRALPAEVGYPEVLGSGAVRVGGEPITWMTSRRLTGGTLRAVWDDLDEPQRERALRAVARPLSALHAWRPRPEIAARLGPPPASSDPQTIIGRTILPLPLDRVRHLVGPAAERAGAHRTLVERAWHWLVDHADLLPRLDDPADVITHGDLHLDNVWWDGDRVTGLLDLEWVRWAPAWTDLVPVRDNALAGDDFSEPHARLLVALRAELPALEVPELERRLTAVELAMQIRQLLVWPAPGPDPAVDHPLELLRRLVASV